jgi:hypothetical protein
VILFLLLAIFGEDVKAADAISWLDRHVVYETPANDVPRRVAGMIRRRQRRRRSADLA